MKKKILACVMGMTMMAALVGCGKSGISNDIVSIEQYKELKVKDVAVIEVTEEEVNESIAYTLQVTAADHGIKDRAAEDGDTVIIDYEGKLDGVAFQGGTAQKQALTLGSGTFIPGFEEQIVGHMPGETFDINVTFPKDYGVDELNGQDTVFTIVFHAIVPTEITDEIATALVGAKTTVEEYREIVKGDLEESNALTAESNYANAVYSAFVKQCTMKTYPEEELKAWTEIMEEEYSMYAEYQGMETDEFLKEYYGTTCEELAKEQVCFSNAANLVAEEEGIELTLEEYDELLTAQAVNFGYEKPEDYEKAYDEAYGEGALKDYFLQEKVVQWLVDNSVKVK